jgi:hypothetical protein
MIKSSGGVKAERAEKGWNRLWRSCSEYLGAGESKSAPGEKRAKIEAAPGTTDRDLTATVG